MRPPFVRFRSPGPLPVIAGSLALMLGACGQSGDLYLPDKTPPTAASAPAQPAETTSEDEEKKKKDAEGATPPPAVTTPPSNTPTTP